MILKTWRTLFLALIAISPLAVVPTDVTVKADPDIQPAKPVVIPSAPSPKAGLKIGETRSQSLVRPQADVIAKIHPHLIGDKSAATVYVRNIPVLTFVDSSRTESNPASKPDQKNPTVKVASKLPSKDVSLSGLYSSINPIERAITTAALFNQFSREGFDANNIVPIWQSGSYSLKFGDKMVLKLDGSMVVPNSGADKAKNAIEAANLLRRLIGNSAPVNSVVGAPPKPVTPVAVLVVSQVFSGMASWYGPGFHGGVTANGERFDQYTLTAAHPSLPFGTPVRVTNTDNGRSVIVRINDRGPYVGGRVIDLSQGAAQVIGLVSSGVAPVRLEVIRR